MTVSLKTFIGFCMTRWFSWKRKLQNVTYEFVTTILSILGLFHCEATFTFNWQVINEPFKYKSWCLKLRISYCVVTRSTPKKYVDELNNRQLSIVHYKEIGYKLHLTNDELKGKPGQISFVSKAALRNCCLIIFAPECLALWKFHEYHLMKFSQSWTFRDCLLRAAASVFIFESSAV